MTDLGDRSGGSVASVCKVTSSDVVDLSPKKSDRKFQTISNTRRNKQTNKRENEGADADANAIEIVITAKRKRRGMR